VGSDGLGGGAALELLNRLGRYTLQQ